MLMEEHVTRVFDLFVEPIREREREKDVKRSKLQLFAFSLYYTREEVA